MKKPSAFEMSRRNLLIGTATSVAVGATSRAAQAQNSAVGVAASAEDASAMAGVSLNVNGALRD